jgi:hypothetical protein
MKFICVERCRKKRSGEVSGAEKLIKLSARGERESSSKLNNFEAIKVLSSRVFRTFQARLSVASIVETKLYVHIMKRLLADAFHSHLPFQFDIPGEVLRLIFLFMCSELAWNARGACRRSL